MPLVFAIKNLHDLILDIGAYAGLASVLGLAVLSALYFSQARDVKRLREWAGRAPERSMEHQIGGRPATQAAQAAQAARAAGAPAPPAAAPAPNAGAKPAAAPAPSAGSAPAAAPPGQRPGVPGAPTAPVRPAGAPAAAGAAAAGAAAAGQQGASAGGGTATAAPPRPPVTPPRSIPSTGGQTAILNRPPRAMDRPWYRRIEWPEPRYIALIVAGVLVLGAGTAYAITELAGSSSSDSGSQAQQGGGDLGGSPKAKATPVDPSKVTVAVLNGTRIAGLAARVGDKVQSGGFQLGNVATATEAQRAESIVEFKPGQNRAARAVARRLHISQIEPLDPSSGDQSLAGDAQVLVIVGADQQRGRSSSGSGSSSSSSGSSGAGAGAGTGTPSTGTSGTGTGTPGTGTPGGTTTPGTGGPSYP